MDAIYMFYKTFLCVLQDFTTKRSWYPYYCFLVACFLFTTLYVALSLLLARLAETLTGCEIIGIERPIEWLEAFETIYLNWLATIDDDMVAADQRLVYLRTIRAIR